MRLSKRLSPYPILNAEDDDYVRGEFQAKVQDEIVGDRLALRTDYRLDNAGLLHLLAEQKALYVTHVECSVVGYRHMFPSHEAVMEGEIPLDDLTDDVEVSTFLMACEDIYHYRDAQFNQSYGDIAFDIERGSLLAIGPEYQLTIRRNGNPEAKVPDILKVRADDNSEDVWVDCSSDAIMVNVPRKIFDAYHNLKQSAKYSMISLLFVPAMMTILTQMKQQADKDDDDGMVEYSWFQVMEKLLNRYGIEAKDLTLDDGNGEKSIFVMAQKIFKYPLLQALDEFSAREEDEEVAE